MSLKVFDTQFGTQGMQNIGEIWYCLDPSLTQGGPSSLLVLVASNMVLLFFNVILEGIPCRGNHKFSRFLYGPLLRVSVPPVLNMGDDLEEWKSNIFPIEKNYGPKNTLRAHSTIYLQHLHLSVLQIMEYKNLLVP
jgi:hypothetical protein